MSFRSCTHVKLNGLRCQNPALNGRSYCHFHDTVQARSLRARRNLRTAGRAVPELPILENAGSVSHEEAEKWAWCQYDAFAERRRLEAETAAEARYLADLRTSAKALEGERKKPHAAKKKQGKRPRRKTKPRTKA